MEITPELSGQLGKRNQKRDIARLDAEPVSDDQLEDIIAEIDAGKARRQVEILVEDARDKGILSKEALQDLEIAVAEYYARREEEERVRHIIDTDRILVY